MNEVIQAIMTRVGAKSYQDTPVTDEDLKTIVKAGIAAPNAYNKQLWHFSVVTDKALLAEMDHAAYLALCRVGICSKDSPYSPLHGAPALIVVSSDRENPYAKQDCSCANQNMALAAHALGYAARFLDVPNYLFQSEAGMEYRERCKIPAGYETVCFLCLGYAADPQQPPAEKNPDVVDYI